MSTRARIAIQTSPGEYLSSYQHSDGYPEKGLGELLLNYWKDFEKTKKAIQLGDASFWGKDIGKKKEWPSYDQETNSYYYRDRELGWEVCKPEQYSSLSELKNSLFDTDIEYLYLLRKGRWIGWYFQSVEKIKKGYPLTSLEKYLESR